MTFKENQVEAWKKMLLEMAITRKDFFLRLDGIYQVVTEHLILIFTQPNSRYINRWCDEIHAWFGSFPKLKYRQNKYPTADDMRAIYLDTWFEYLDDRLQYHVDMAYDKENQPSPQLSLVELDKLRNQIKNYLNFIIENIDPKTGAVDRQAATNKIKELANKGIS